MELIKFEDYLKKSNKTNLVAAIGQFDGLHLAHMALFKKTLEIAENKNISSCIITFDPHPDFVIKKGLDETYITPLLDKFNEIAKFAIDYMIVIHFDTEVQNTSKEDFIKKYLERILVTDVVVGFDFTFGKFGAGKAQDIEVLSNNTIKTTIINEIKYHDRKIGSTEVRNLLSLGKVEEVIDLLGRPYHIKGEVISGKKIGRTLNIPTANLLIDLNYVKVKSAVYAVVVKHNQKKYCGIANIGHNPSFNFTNKLSVEVHILDFDQDIYGCVIDVWFISLLREEMKFATTNDFIEQINKDKFIAIAKTKPFLDN